MTQSRRLIFIDGIIGVGKSRLAQRLWRHLRVSGADAEWFAEPEIGHPLHELGDLSKLGTAQALERVLDAWRNFVAERAATARVTFLDATLLQATARFFEAFSIPQPERLRALAAMLRIAAPLSPALIYLRPETLDDFIDRLAEARGADWRNYMEDAFRSVGGLSGMKGYYAERLRQDLAMIDALDLPRIVLESSPVGWGRRYAGACAFLGIDAPEPLEAYPGDIVLLAERYREPVSGVSWRLEYRDGRLGFCAGDRPRLIHLEGTRFIVEGRPLDAVFTLDSRGRPVSLRFSGPLRDDPLSGTEWRRVVG